MNQKTTQGQTAEDVKQEASELEKLMAEANEQDDKPSQPDPTPTPTPRTKSSAKNPDVRTVSMGKVALTSRNKQKGEALKNLTHRVPESMHEDIQLFAEWADISIEDLMFCLLAQLKKNNRKDALTWKRAKIDALLEEDE